MKSEYFWALLTLIIAILLALILLNVVKDDAQSETPELPPSAYDEQLDKLDREAIEDGYHDHVALLFSNWVRETHHQQPFRALTGHRLARKAFIESMTAIDARKR